MERQAREGWVFGLRRLSRYNWLVVQEEGHPALVLWLASESQMLETVEDELVRVEEFTRRAAAILDNGDESGWERGSRRRRKIAQYHDQRQSQNLDGQAVKIHHNDNYVSKNDTTWDISSGVLRDISNNVLNGV